MSLQDRLTPYQRDEAPAPAAAIEHDHHVEFYSNGNVLCDHVSEFINEGLETGERCLLVISSEREQAIRESLGALGVDVDAACLSGTLTFVDADELLSKITADYKTVPSAFHREVGGLIRRLNHGATLRVFGEMVDILQQRGLSAAAVELEALWNDLAGAEKFSLLCGYYIGAFDSSSDATAFEHICREHNHVYPSRDIARLQHKTLALEKEVERRREAEEELRDFIENAAEALHWVGPDGTIYWANRAEMQMLGYSPDEYIGRNIVEFHADTGALEDILSRLSRGEELHNYEARLRCKDGSIRHVIINSNVRWKKGRFVHTCCFTRDVTDRVLAEQAKSQFLAVMSHELRTPLNAILGYQELLAHGVAGSLTETQNQYLDRIRQGAQHLIGMVDQVLSLSRIEAGAETLMPGQHDVVALLRETCNLLTPLSLQRGLAFETTWPDREIVAYIDARKLNQIFLNLLSNALKFTERGAVHVELSADDRQFTVHISDTGPGIPEEATARIFEPFVQLDGSNTRTHGGTGLGLAVSRNIARLMGGDIVVRSKVGEGSCFTLQVPLGTAAAPAARPVAQPQAKL